MTCKFCGRADEGNAGDYYHKKRCEASTLMAQLETASDEERPALERALEMARYVGD